MHIVLDVICILYVEKQRVHADEGIEWMKLEGRENVCIMHENECIIKRIFIFSPFTLGSSTRIKDLHIRPENLLPNTDEYMTYEGEFWHFFY